MADGMRNAQKAPPHAEEAELDVLGGLMLNNEAIDEVRDLLSEGDFYQHAHQLIYGAILELAAVGNAVDFSTVGRALADRGRLEEVGGIAALISMVDTTPSAYNVIHYARTVLSKSRLRQLISTGQRIADMGYRPEGRDPDELLEDAERQVMALRKTDAKDAPSSMGSIMLKVERQIRSAHAKEAMPGISTGFSDLDRWIKGLRPAKHIVLAGRPGMGKSVLALNIAENVALGLGLPALYFSMEMTKEDLIYRSIARQCQIELDRLLDGDISADEFGLIEKARERFDRAPLYIDERGAHTPTSLGAAARRQAARTGLSLIVVDFIQQMKVPGQKSRVLEVGECSRSLQTLGKDLGVPVISISSLNRGVEGRDNKRPQMSDLRESGDLESDADVVAMVYRDDVYNPDSELAGTSEIIFRKNRQGKLGSFHMAFRGEYSEYAGLTEQPVRATKKPGSRGFKKAETTPSAYASKGGEA